MHHEKSDMLSCGFFTGIAACMGGYLLVLGGGIRQALGLLPDREAAALTLLVMASLIFSGLPAGCIAGKHMRRTPIPLWAAMVGAWLAPVLAWFAGLEPGWPRCWAAAWALGFAGNWIGLGAGLLLAGRRRQGPSVGTGEGSGAIH